MPKRSAAEITSSLLDFYRVRQPKLDTKPGTVARDTLVDGLSQQLANLYNEIGRVSNLQSWRLALGIDLDRLGSNIGTPRNPAKTATVFGIFTFAEINSDLALTKGDLVTAKNGATFTVVNSTIISKIFANKYRAFASSIRADLDNAGITDQYAVQALLKATAVGTQGNISKNSLISTNIAGIDNVTNINAGGGGSLQEDDAAYRNRVLAVFSGANTGTATGYRNAVLADPLVSDAVVILPGDSLMTRDGTQVSIAEDGTRTVVSDGSGGKVDVIVFGIRLLEILDSFIYRDKSNTGDPTNSKNDYVFGQIASDLGKTVTRRRLENLQNGVLPAQPVNNIVEVSGSLSGANFIEESVDSLGRISGNYKLVKDTGAYAGSPWGFDRLHWIDNNIRDYNQDKTKEIFNGQDSLGFTDVTKISKITQNIVIKNENASVSASDRSSLQLPHYPITNVKKVINVTTGERYVVTNQNPDGTGAVNKTGRVIISGKTLPSISHVLQVDYTWVFSYDPYFDYDNRTTLNNPRNVNDSIDWGFSNVVNREEATLISTGSFLTVNTIHPVSAVVKVNVFSSETSATVTLVSNRLAVIMPNTISNVVSVIRNSDTAELWNTNKLDGTFSGQTIFLPTDTSGTINDIVNIVYNTVDVFNLDGYQGSFNSNQITIVPSDNAEAGEMVEVTYIANVNSILPSIPLKSLPAIRNANAFSTSSLTGIGNQPTSHIFSAPGVVEKNLRVAPSALSLTIDGQISPGVITVNGMTVFGVSEAVFTVANSGLKQDLSFSLKKELGLTSKNIISSNYNIIKIAKVEKVTATSNFEVISSDFTYDLKGYKLLNNIFVKNESVVDSLLKNTEFELPETVDNINNAPVTGTRLRVTFYYSKTSDSENVNFSEAGTLYTNKKFAFVDTISISSGFTSAGSATATIKVSNLNQPVSKSRYKVSYDYIAPKPNERISVRFNQDKMIADATLALENSRPVNADVLAKTSNPIDVDATIKIGILSDNINSSDIVKQNVKDVITSILNPRMLGSKIDGSDLVTQAYTVAGVDSARVIYFNKTGKTGSVLSVTAQKNEYIRPNNVIVELEE